ncbi:MAG: VOC family protein [Pseudomonadota bacterium]
MTIAFDHIILGCLDLDAGAEALSALFGAPPAGRGVHKMMGTHNALWNLGDAYVELVAVNPEAPHPGRPRWFGLDDPATLARLEGGPRLLTWAVAGPGAEAVAAAAPFPMGGMEAFARDDLTWRVAVPEAGTPGLDGAFPLTIEWTGGLHPAKRLGDQGLRCASLAVTHPQVETLRRALGEPPAPVTLREGPPQIEAVLQTPKGEVVFSAFH